jgi:hypothetical protein
MLHWIFLPTVQIDFHKVLSKAIEKLKNNKQFIVHEQYPIEIIDRRRQLVPIMKDARGKGHEAVLKEDRLYTDKRRFYPRPFVSSPPLELSNYSSRTSILFWLEPMHHMKVYLILNA